MLFQSQKAYKTLIYVFSKQLPYLPLLHIEVSWRNLNMLLPCSSAYFFPSNELPNYVIKLLFHFILSLTFLSLPGMPFPSSLFDWITLTL